MPTIPTYSGAVPYQAGVLSGRTSREMYEEEKLRQDAREQARMDLEMMKMEQQRELAELEMTYRQERNIKEDLRFEKEYDYKYDLMEQAERENQLKFDLMEQANQLKSEYYEILKQEKALKGTKTETKLITSLVDDIISDSQKIGIEKDQMSNYLNENLISLEKQGYDKDTVEKIRDGLVHTVKGIDPAFDLKTVQTSSGKEYLAKERGIRRRQRSLKEREALIREFERIGNPEDRVAFENFNYPQKKAYLEALKKKEKEFSRSFGSAL